MKNKKLSKLFHYKGDERKDRKEKSINERKRDREIERKKKAR